MTHTHVQFFTPAPGFLFTLPKKYGHVLLFLHENPMEKQGVNRSGWKGGKG